MCCHQLKVFVTMNQFAGFKLTIAVEKKGKELEVQFADGAHI